MKAKIRDLQIQPLKSLMEIQTMRSTLAFVLTVCSVPAFCSGGMVFTSTTRYVLPSHSSLSGTYWGWNFRTNLSSAQSAQPQVFVNSHVYSSSAFLDLKTFNTATNYTDPADPGVAGYQVFERHDSTIDFQLGSYIHAHLKIGESSTTISDSPVPGEMIGLQDRHGRFFGVGLGTLGTQRYVRIINNPFTGSGTEWVLIPALSTFFGSPQTSEDYTVELVIAGSKATLLIGGEEFKNANGNILSLDAGAPLNSLIFSQWVSYGGAIVGDYSTTSSGHLILHSLSYY